LRQGATLQAIPYWSTLSESRSFSPRWLGCFVVWSRLPTSQGQLPMMNVLQYGIHCV
jgi:hypothetical protein